MVDSVKYNEWFFMAQKDYRSAKILLDHDADNEIICFHCQQAVEKYLKGYLIFMSGRLFEGHNLIKLCYKAIQFDDSFKSFLKDLAFLNTFYTETRYPAEDPLIIDKEDALECIRIASNIIDKIDNIIK